MAIVLNCPSCGKKLKVPDSAAGKLGKCPACKSAVRIPAQAAGAQDPTEYEDYGAAPDDSTYGFENVSDSELNDYDTPSLPDRRPCPMCGEMIVATAAKCRYCGEVFDKPRKKKTKSRSSRSWDPDELTPIDWLICIFCGLWGCIVGIVAMCTSSSTRGLKMIGLSFAFIVIWRLVLGLIAAILLPLLK